MKTPIRTGQRRHFKEEGCGFIAKITGIDEAYLYYNVEKYYPGSEVSRGKCYYPSIFVDNSVLLTKEEFST